MTVGRVVETRDRTTCFDPRRVVRIGPAERIGTTRGPTTTRDGMRPTFEQIAVAAYHRWERRGRAHGFDREDWSAAEKDLVFGLNYRYVARLPLTGPRVEVGKPDTLAPRARRCRFCEQGEPAVSFQREELVVPPALGNTALVAWDECDGCRAEADSALGDAFETFARRWLAGDDTTPALIPVAAYKGLVRLALAVVPAAELHHFDDTMEWVANPDHARDAVLLDDLGCHVYTTPTPLPAPFVALARRVADESGWPYMLFFLGTGRAVFQTHLPLSPRDDERDDPPARGPELSMSVGSGTTLRASRCRFVEVGS